MTTHMIVLRTDEPTKPNVVYRYHLYGVRHVVRASTSVAEAAIGQHLQAALGSPHRIEYRDGPHLSYFEPSWDTDLTAR